MSLKERITDDMKAAMRSGEKERLGLIRMITAAIKQREVDERITLDDAQVLSVLEKMIKQRKESLGQFQAGNRQDLVDKEAAEITLLQGYLPSQLSDAEIDALIQDAIAGTGAASIKDMGKVMAVIKGKAKGRPDMAAVGVGAPRCPAKLSGRATPAVPTCTASWRGSPASSSRTSRTMLARGNTWAPAESTLRQRRTSPWATRRLP